MTNKRSLPGYSEGFDAFNNNKPISDNPYSWQRPERQNWHAGWMEAREHERIGYVLGASLRSAGLTDN